MNIRELKENEKLTVFIDGSIDTNTAQKLLSYLQGQVFSIKELVLDFSKVDYVSSAGLRVLLLAQKAMKSVDGTMVVANVNEEIMETFELTCFTNVLTIV